MRGKRCEHLRRATRRARAPPRAGRRRCRAWARSSMPAAVAVRVGHRRPATADPTQSLAVDGDPHLAGVVGGDGAHRGHDVERGARHPGDRVGPAVHLAVEAAVGDRREQGVGAVGGAHATEVDARLVPGVDDGERVERRRVGRARGCGRSRCPTPIGTTASRPSRSDGELGQHLDRAVAAAREHAVAAGERLPRDGDALVGAAGDVDGDGRARRGRRRVGRWHGRHDDGPAPGFTTAVHCTARERSEPDFWVAALAEHHAWTRTSSTLPRTLAPLRRWWSERSDPWRRVACAAVDPDLRSLAHAEARRDRHGRQRAVGAAARA